MPPGSGEQLPVGEAGTSQKTRDTASPRLKAVPSGSDPDAIARYERRRLTGEFARVLDGVTAPRGDHIETGLD